MSIWERIKNFLLLEISEFEARRLLERWRGWQYHNTALLTAGLVFLVIFVRTPFAHTIIQEFRGLSYIGVFIAGALFPSTFTFAAAVVLLYGFANELNPYVTALVAGAGAMTSDYMILRFFKDRVFEELRPIFAHFKGRRLSALFHTPYFGWMLPVMGMFVIASPLPDEVGLGLLGAGKISTKAFLSLAFVLNSVGILAIVLAARLT